MPSECRSARLSPQIKLEETTRWFADKERNLKRPITELDDVRSAIAQLKELRERESSIDVYLEPIEEMYVML